MIYASWSFDTFEKWIHEQAETMRKKGFRVDCHVVSNESGRLRVESSDNIGEVVVWSDGSAQQMIASLDSGSYLLESDGLKVGGARYDVFFRDFFSRF